MVARVVSIFVTAAVCGTGEPTGVALIADWFVAERPAVFRA